MVDINVNPPLTNVQQELLRVFATQVSEEHLLELRQVIARFLLEKARDRADQIWEEKGLTEQGMINWTNKNHRK